MTGGGPIPGRCPSCGSGMVASIAHCESCGVEVSGRFSPCPVCLLEGDDRRLYDLFLGSRGNLKKIERTLGLSYPTVRLRVDELLARLSDPKEPPCDRLEILARVRRGEITVSDAVDLLGGGSGSNPTAGSRVR